MTSEQLTGPFMDAFEKSDPGEGGCPDLGPDFAQASATDAVGAGAGATIAAGSQDSAKERRVAAEAQRAFDEMLVESVASGEERVMVAINHLINHNDRSYSSSSSGNASSTPTIG